MSKEKIFKELIAAMAKEGSVSASGYEILLEKGKDLGFDKNTVDLLIKLELAEPSARNYDHTKDTPAEEPAGAEEHIFKSAITRGGSILTPDILIVSDTTVTYKKRNKYLINIDSITVPISRISSVELDTGLLGTDIIIKTYGTGEILCHKFTKSDAREIRKLIQERQKKF